MSMSNKDFHKFLEPKAGGGKRSKAPPANTDDDNADTKSAKRPKRDLGFDLQEQIRLERAENKAGKKRLAKQLDQGEKDGKEKAKHKGKGKGKNKKGKKKGKKDADADEKEEGDETEKKTAGYRDRAKERRLGIVVEEHDAVAIEASNTIIPSEYAHFMSATKPVVVAAPIVNPILKQIGTHYPSGNKTGPVFQSFFAKALYVQMCATRQIKISPDIASLKPGKRELVFELINTEHDGIVEQRNCEDGESNIIESEAVKARAPILLHPEQRVMHEIGLCFSDPERSRRRQEENTEKNNKKKRKNKKNNVSDEEWVDPVSRSSTNFRPRQAPNVAVFDDSYDLFGDVGRDYVVKVKPQKKADVESDTEMNKNEIVGPTKPSKGFDIAAAYGDASDVANVFADHEPTRFPHSYEHASHDNLDPLSDIGPARPSQGYDVAAAYGTNTLAENENEGPARPSHGYAAGDAYDNPDADVVDDDADVGPARPPQGYDNGTAYSDADADADDTDVGPARPPQGYNTDYAYVNVESDADTGPARPPHGYDVGAAYGEIPDEAAAVDSTVLVNEWVHFPTADELDEDGKAGNVELVEIDSLDSEECAQIITILQFKLNNIMQRIQSSVTSV